MELGYEFSITNLKPLDLFVYQIYKIMFLIKQHKRNYLHYSVYIL